MAHDKACRNCRYISLTKDVCPNCGSNDLTENWVGFTIIINHEKSALAPALEVKTNGKYAIKIK